MDQPPQNTYCPQERAAKAGPASAASLGEGLVQAAAPHSPVSRSLQMCLRRSVVRRAITVALIVGPILTLINQYDVIADRAFDLQFFLKLGLTFLVPYSVSTYSSVMATLAQATRVGRPVIVDIYPIAGKQLFFRVPESFCKECDLTIRSARRAVTELGNPPEIVVRIRPWLNHLPQALLRGGWHPPVVTINGKRFTQGVVPDGDALRETIRKLLSPKEAE